MAPFSRVYDLSENVVPAQGAEAIADTPGSVSPTTTTDRERRTDDTDVTSLDSNKFDENSTRTPENRVDVTTLSSRRQQAKRSVPVPRLSSNAFSAVLQQIDRVSSANPSASFDRAVVAGVQSYCYRNNQNTLNVLAAVVPTLITSGNFDASDSNALRLLNQHVATMRHQADGSDPLSGPGGPDPMAGADPMGGMGGGMAPASMPGMDPAATGGLPGADMGPQQMAPGNAPGGLSGPGGADGTAGQPGGGMGGVMDGLGGALGDMGDALGLGGGGAPGGPPPPTGGGIAGPNGDGSGPPPGVPGGATDDPQKAMQQMRASRAPRLAKMILAGQIEFGELTRQAQNEVRLWVQATDDNQGSPTTNSAPGSNENDSDNRQNPHNDGANSDSMVGDTPEYANQGGGGTPDVDPNWKNSNRRRRRLADTDTNRDVAEKDTNRIDVTAPNQDTSDRAQQSQYDRGEYDQNGPILDKNGPSADKSTDQNWPPKASSVDAMRLADLYVAMNMVPAEKKYEVVAGFENMNSWIVKDRLKVLGYVQKIAQEQAPQQRQDSRSRSMVPQSSNGQQQRGGMPSMGRTTSLNGRSSGGSIDMHFLAL